MNGRVYTTTCELYISRYCNETNEHYKHRQNRFIERSALFNKYNPIIRALKKDNVWKISKCLSNGIDILKPIPLVEEEYVTCSQEECPEECPDILCGGEPKKHDILEYIGYTHCKESILFLIESFREALIENNYKGDKLQKEIDKKLEDCIKLAIIHTNHTLLKTILKNGFNLVKPDGTMRDCTIYYKNVRCDDVFRSKYTEIPPYREKVFNGIFKRYYGIQKG